MVQLRYVWDAISTSVALRKALCTVCEAHPISWKFQYKKIWAKIILPSVCLRQLFQVLQSSTLTPQPCLVSLSLSLCLLLYLLFLYIILKYMYVCIYVHYLTCTHICCIVTTTNTYNLSKNTTFKVESFINMFHITKSKVDRVL